MSKLAIAAETDADRYDTETRIKCYQCGIDDVDKNSGKLPTVVDGVMKAMTFARQEEVKAWEQEITPCEHTLCLQQDPGRQIQSQDLGHCSMCELKENLWLCLQCGNLACGRAQFGGVGGNSHGLAHSDATSHPVAVKLGSITPEGTADVYCYACNDERTDPELASHLAHWGINIAEREKTEKTLTELQIDQNLRWEFSMTTEDGMELQPLFGKGFTGLKNLGNSCYLSSILQCLFDLPVFQNRYYHPNDTPPGSSKPAEDLETQMRKVADGLLSGRYSHPDSDVISSEDSPEIAHQKGLAPAMLKHLIGRGHEEFSTMRQQDAFELLLHIFKLVTRSSHPAPLSNPVDSFRFVLEHRLQCLSCKKVRYKSDEQDNISVPVPVRRIPEALSKGANQDGQETAKEEFDPVSLKECLDIFTGAETVELRCPGCGNNDGFSKRALFKTFPEVLAVNARRFELVNWVPTKLDVPVVVGDEPFDLDSYKSSGLQPNEELLPEDADSGTSNKFVANESSLAQLEGMGFPKVRCEKALHATGNADAEAAMNWLFGHMEDPDIDTPLDLKDSRGSGGDTNAATPERIETLGAMGFGSPQARKALIETGGDMDRAVEWLFSHPDDQGDFGEDRTGESNDPSQEAKGLPGSDRLPARFQLHSIVCHKGGSIHAGHYVAFIRKHINGESGEPWVLFNDEKVVKAVDVEEMKKFAYVIACILCGAPIGGQHRTWLHEFRAVYTNGHEWTAPRFSGVGIRPGIGDDPILAPSDIRQRYDDPGYDGSSNIELVGMEPMYAEDNDYVPLELRDPDSPPIELCSWGFFFHESCWKLLNAACHPREIDARCLNDFCRSCPSYSHGVIDWGHGYGGIFEVNPDPDDVLPGSEASLGRYKEIERRKDLDYLPDEVYHVDPLDSPELEHLLKLTTKEIHDIDAAVKTLFSTAITREDCFADMPLEIRQTLLLYLRSEDVLNLYLASRTFASTPLPQIFWASRFQLGFEFASIFEVRGDPVIKPKRRDWKALLYGLRFIASSSSVRNRRRIWAILQPLAAALNTFANVECSGKPSRTFYDPDFEQAIPLWRCAGGDLRDNKKWLSGGCRTLYARTACVTSRITGIHVSIIQFANVEYVTGIRFIQLDDDTANLGYIIQENEVPLKIGKEGIGNRLRGFHLAVSQRGIRAIAVITETDEVSEWVGNPENIPRARLIQREEPVSALKADFDGFKMISIGIPEAGTKDEGRQRSLLKSSTLRDKAQWFPDIPRESLFLNEHSFHGEYKNPVLYWPLIHFQFGGSGGIYLPNIVALSVWIIDYEKLMGIEIEYNVEIDGATIHKFGRCGPFSEREERNRFDADFSPSKDQKVSFNIDGPSGEYIEGVDVGKLHQSGRPTPLCLQIRTNRGRSATFPQSLPSHDAFTTLTVEESTKITGLYAMIARNDGLIHIGVISEDIHC
ncbi:MAG: hypothetical protein M1837_000240 [Sclerophora amabilis]|nr:MAG: hypothetical protein M1837_000240 [Sclerophora amabilis]